MTPSTRPPYASASCEVHRNFGPKGVHGCVTLEFERAVAFTFSSSVAWPVGENLDPTVEQSVREALRQMPVAHAYACRLVAIKWHAVDSCASGFAMAASHATRAAVEQLPSKDPGAA